MQDFKDRKDSFTREDLSRKGSIDSRILELVNFINTHNCYITTSSCSGRTIVFTNSETKKKGCNWLFVSHDTVSPEDIINSLDHHCGSAILKFEPFILHTQCLTIESARKLHQCGIEAGFKNSGISIGKKIIVAIRSTLSLEVPLSSDSTLLVTKEYISFIVNICNEKMLNNWQRIERFHSKLQIVNSPMIKKSHPKKLQRVESDKAVHQNFKKEELESSEIVLDIYEDFNNLLNDTVD